MKELNIGDKFKATDKLGKTTNWIVLNKKYHPEREVDYPFYDFIATGKYLEELEKILNRKNNTMNRVDVIYNLDIEQQWLEQRKIEIIKNKTDEWCPNCEEEVELEASFTIQTCPNCNEEIFPCSMCDNYVVNCNECPLEKTE